MVIPKTALQSDAAYAWINFMLQPEVAAQVCQRLYTPNRVAVEQLPHKSATIPTYFRQSRYSKCERIAHLGKFDAVYERYWTS